MAYTAGNFDMEHVLIQWGGTLPGGETWSCSLRTGAQESGNPAGDVPSEGAVSSWLNGSIKDAVLAYHTNALTSINPVAKLTFVKANRIAVDGHYMDPSTNEYVYASIAGTGGAFNPLPNQCTIAVSLTTGYKRGPAHRGRFYLPSPAVQVAAADGLCTQYEADSIAAATKTFLESIGDVPGLDTPFSQTPMVFSRKSGAPAHRAVTGVEVGRVVDTQRRRRRSLKETYRPATLDLGEF